MIHRVFGKKLSRDTKERKALLKSLANSVILYEKVVTTQAKAKSVKPFIEKLVTIAKVDSLQARRNLISKLGLENSVNKLLEVVGPTFKERPGGYLRLTKLGSRAGDRAPMVAVEFVEEISAPRPKAEKKVKAAQQSSYQVAKGERKAPALKAEKKKVSAKKDEKRASKKTK